MTTQAKVYIYGVIAVGMGVVAAALANWTAGNPAIWVSYVVLAGLASIVKVEVARLGRNLLSRLPVLHVRDCTAQLR